ncbi:MAG: VPLPA-CTERM sorting domain-containing protein, partial [Amylibacter sp.]
CSGGNHRFSTGAEEAVADGTVKVYDGLNIEFSSSDYAYFDTVPDDGGLGVCQTDTDQCGSDDNLTLGETVTIMFDEVMYVAGLIFTDVNHNPVVGTNMLTINGGDYTFAAASAAVFFTDSLTFGYGTSLGQDYYVNGLTATIPVPAAGFLLLGGLGGLAALRRRRKAA